MVNYVVLTFEVQLLEGKPQLQSPPVPKQTTLTSARQPMIGHSARSNCQMAFWIKVSIIMLLRVIMSKL